MGLTFLNDYAPLPSTAPADHPHVIDIAAYAPDPGDKATQLKLPDAVVTMLHCISAATLAAFLDASPSSSFRLVQTFKDPRNTDKFVIARKANKIFVCTWRPRGTVLVPVKRSADATCSGRGRDGARAGAVLGV
jgi:hypothetical protein